MKLTLVDAAGAPVSATFAPEEDAVHLAELVPHAHLSKETGGCAVVIVEKRVCEP